MNFREIELPNIVIRWRRSYIYLTFAAGARVMLKDACNWGVVSMRVDAVTKSLEQISKELPDIGKDELQLVERCLEDCFETGRTWDSIPILVHEAEVSTPDTRRLLKLLAKTRLRLDSLASLDFAGLSQVIARKRYL